MDKADGVDDDVAVGVLVGDGDGGFAGEKEAGDGVEGACFRGFLLIEGEAVNFATGLDQNGDVGGAVRIGGIGEEDFVFTGFQVGGEGGSAFSVHDSLHNKSYRSRVSG